MIFSDDGSERIPFNHPRGGDDSDVAGTIVNPIIVLDGGLRLDLVMDATRWALGPGANGRPSAESAALEIRAYRFTGMVEPPAPPAALSFEVRPGGLETWRSGGGHFLAHPCGKCGRVTIAFSADNESDFTRAVIIAGSIPRDAKLQVGVLTGEHCSCAACVMEALMDDMEGEEDDRELG